MTRYPHQTQKSLFPLAGERGSKNGAPALESHPNGCLPLLQNP